MKNEKLNNLRDSIKDYIGRLQESDFPGDLKSKVSIFLSGSTGWGIKEGFDQKADWDLHLILSNEDYVNFVESYGINHVIDDHNNQPIVFGQIRSEKWLRDRISKLRQGDCLYTWIYNNCVNIQDPLNIQKIINEYTDLFNANQEELLKYHYVTYAVRKLDAKSAAERGIEIGARVSNIEMVKSAMQVISIIHGKPYPYNKWLGKHLELLGEEEFVKFCEISLQSSTLKNIVDNAKPIKEMLTGKIAQKYGPKLWVDEWWKFNENPVEINLIDPKTLKYEMKYV